MTIQIIHLNPDENWEEFTYLCGDGKEKVNNKCKINSKYCSEEDSDIDGLCKWHRLRMAKTKIVECSCNEHIIITGDSVGRNIFREFYDFWEIPVQDSCGEIYCCGESQNTGDYVKKCGEMFICNIHDHLH